MNDTLAESSVNKANNGERVLVRFYNFAGLAGRQERNGKVFVAFTPQTSEPLKNVGLVKGRAHKIIAVSHSPYIRGMVILEVEDIHDTLFPIEDADPPPDTDDIP